MSKRNVVDELAGKHGLERSEASRAFDNVTAAIGGVLERGERVRLPGVGTLVRETRAPRTYRNPRTGAPVAKPAKVVTKLKPSSTD